MNADFSLLAGSLQLDLSSDDAADSITIGRASDEYTLELGSGVWSGSSGPGIDGINTGTLTVDVGDADRLALLGSSDLAVLLQASDYSDMTDGVSLASIGSALSIGGTFQATTLSITSSSENPFILQPLDVQGDVDLTTAASVVDTFGGEIRVTGDFSITTGMIPGDYDNDGMVATSDYSAWRTNFGQGDTDADGNGDGKTDAADYTLWRDNLGRTRDAGTTGIDVGRGSNLSVNGKLVTVSQAGGDINIGVDNGGLDSGKHVELGSFAFETPGNVRVFEDSSDGLEIARHDFDGDALVDTNLGGDVELTADQGTLQIAEIQARDLNLTALGSVSEVAPNAAPGALLVTRDLTVTTRSLAADFNGDLSVDSDDYALWRDNYNQPGAAGITGDANLDGVVDAADYTVWRDQLGMTLSVGTSGIRLGSNLDLKVEGHTVLLASVGSINVGVMPDSRTVELNNVRFKTSANVNITEDSADGFQLRRSATEPAGSAGEVELTTTAGDLVLDSLMATKLTVVSAANVTDVTGTQLLVLSDSSIRALGDIVLADEISDATSFINGVEFTGANIVVGSAGEARFGTLGLAADTAAINSRGNLILEDVTANDLSLSSLFAITQEAGTTISVSGPAAFEAGINITLANAPGDILSVAGDAEFVVPISGPQGNVTLGQGGTATFGSLAIEGVSAVVSEADSTLLAGIDLEQLTLNSAGGLEDTLTAQITISNLAALTAQDDIVLADNVGNLLTGGFGPGAAISIESVTGDLSVGDLGTVLVGSMSVNGDEVDVQIDGDAAFDQIQARRAEIAANGRITGLGVDVAEDATFTALDSIDLIGANVGGLANFIAQGNVTVSSSNTRLGSVAIDAVEAFVTESGGLLLDNISVQSLAITTTGDLEQVAGTTITVAQLADLTAGGDITIGTNGTANFGSLSASGQTVVIEESSGTTLETIDAQTLSITSAGDLTDDSNIVVVGNATFVATGSIVLADSAGDILSVGGDASFSAGSNITLGPAGSVNFGTLSLSGVDAFVQEESDTDVDQVTVANLQLESTRGVNSVAGSQVIVTEDATVTAQTSIALATVAGTAFEVGQDASFVAIGAVKFGELGTANFGTLSIDALSADVHENSTTELKTIDLTDFDLESDDFIFDTAAASIVVSGSGTFTGRTIRLGENASDVLSVGTAVFDGGRLLTIGPAGTANFGTLAITANTASVQEDSATTFRDVSVGDLQITSSGDIDSLSSSQILITSSAEFTGTNITFANQAGQTVSISDQATFNASNDVVIATEGMANFGTISATANSATLFEDSATELSQANVGNLLVDSAAEITDKAGASIEVTGNATFAAATDIVLGADTADVLTVGQLATFGAGDDINIGPDGTANFGSLSLSGDVATVFEDSSTVLQDVMVGTLNLTSGGGIGDNSNIVILGDAMFVSAGPITLAENVGDVLTVTGEATFVSGGDIELGLGGSANFGSLVLDGDNATVRVGSALALGNIDLDSFSLNAMGNITDVSGAMILVGGELDLTTTADIILSDNAADTTTVSGEAILNATGNVTIGAAGATNFGSLRLMADDATIQEDSNTRINAIDTSTLSLVSAGSVTDALGTTIDVAGDALFESTDPAGGVFLSDFGTDVISVGGLATFITALPAGVFIGSPGTANFMSLSASGGAVTISEDSDMVLADISAGTLSLTAAGSITDDGTGAAPASIAVTGTADFDASGNIELADEDNDSFTVGNAAQFATPADVSVGMAAPTLPAEPDSVTEFGSIEIHARDVLFFEDNSTLIDGAVARNLQLTSGGSITDDNTAAIDVVNQATVSANGGSITLADEGANLLNVGGDASFAATNSIALGQGAAAEFGRLSLDGGAAIVNEGAGGAAGTELLNVSVTSLVLESAGPVTDSLGASVEVTNNSRVIAEGAITLAEAGAELLDVGGTALWQSTGGQTIDLGISYPGGVRPIAGNPSSGAVTFGSVGFVSVGDVRIAQDSAVNVVLGDFDGNPVTAPLGSVGDTVVLIADDSDGAANSSGVDITLDGTVTASHLRLQADGAIQQAATGMIAASTLQIVTGYDFSSFDPTSELGPAKSGTFSRDVMLEAENMVGEFAAAVANGSLRLVNKPELVIANTDVDGRNLIGLRIVDARGLVDAADVAQDLELELQSIDSGIRQQRVDVIAALNPQVEIDIDTIRATFTVASGSSSSLVDMEIDDAVAGDALLLNNEATDKVRDRTNNRFYVDNSGVSVARRETQLVFESPVGKPEDVFVADETAIQLGFTAADRSFQLDVAGQLAVVAGRSPDSTDAITQDGAVNVAGDAQFHAAGSLTMGEITLTDLKILGPIGVTTDGGDATLVNEGAFVFRGDIDTFLPNGDLSVTSTLAGIGDEVGDQSPDPSVTSEAEASIVVASGNAIFDAATDIVLADNRAGGVDRIAVSGLASFVAGGDINVGVVPGIDPLIDSAGTAEFGALSLNGMDATVQEDLGGVAGTLLDTVDVNSLNIISAGAVTDVVGATINVRDNANVAAGDNIVLSDNAADILSVGLLADFMTDDDILISPSGTTNFGSLSLRGRTSVAGNVMVQEDSSTLLVEVEVTILDLTSNATNPADPLLAGNITDALAAMISVEGDATFKAEGAITLADIAGDVLVVDDLATFSAGHFVASPNSAKQDITIGDAGVVMFGTLSLFGKTAEVMEDDTTDLVDVSVADLILTSQVSIQDEPGADLQVDNDATLRALTRHVVLANENGDRFEVGGHLDVDANRDISIGIDPELFADSTTKFGTLSLRGRDATVFEDDAMLIDTIDVSNLVLGSADRISDLPAASIQVLGDATMEATNSIELGNDAGDDLRVGGLAEFAADTAILLGLGGPANFGTLSLTGVVTAGVPTRGLMASVVEASGTTFSEVLLTDLTLTADGKIEDEPAGSVNVSGLATFTVAQPDEDIVLGDLGATVDFNRLRVVAAQNVSLQEQNGFVLDGLTVNNTLIASADAGSIVQTVGTSLVAPSIALRTPAGGILLEETFAERFAAEAGGATPASNPVFDDVVTLLATERIEIDQETNIETPSDGLAPTKLNLLPDGVTIAPEGFVPLESISLGSQFGVMLLHHQGDLTLGKIVDPTTGGASAVDGIRSSDGQVYVATEAVGAGGPADGVLTISGIGITDNVAVKVTNDSVFTAVAAGDLVIQPGTKLEAEGAMGSGRVTEVDQYLSYDDRDLRVVEKAGVQLIVTPPGDQLDSATSRFVGAGNDFTQMIELVVGSPGETNLQLLVDYADDQLDTLSLDAQMLSVENVFTEEFLFDPEARPVFDELPTHIRLMNDPRINLFEDGGDRNLNRSITARERMPERIDNFVLARVQNPPAPVDPPAPPEVRVLFEPPQTVSAPPLPVSVFLKEAYEELGTLQSQDQVIVIYGRVNETGDDIAPETEETWEQGGSDYAAKIKQKVRESDRAAGQYMIKAQSTGKTEPDKETFIKRSTVPSPFDSTSIDTGSAKYESATFGTESIRGEAIEPRIAPGAIWLAPTEDDLDRLSLAEDSHQLWNEAWRNWTADNRQRLDASLIEEATIGRDDYAASDGEVSGASALMVGGVVLARQSAKPTSQGWIKRMIRRRPR